jgi:hypothetical protein
VYYSVGGGEEYLVCEESVGVRSIRFDPEKGLFLNGEEIKLKGVCLHHDGGCLGAAMTAEVWQRRLQLLKEAGCNAIRCSHNPHMPELYQLCDHMGFMVIDEAFDEWENPKNKWSIGHNVYPPKHQGYYEDFHEWHQKDLLTMVKRDRNHASVIMWSIGNEIDYPNDPYCHPMFETMTGNNDANKPASERRYDTNRPNTERMIVLTKELSDIVRSGDQSRPVTLAFAFPELSAQLGLFDSLDVIGYNYKEHLYEQDHARFPEKPFLGSENGHSFQAWEAVVKNPYISGQFLWTGIDYLGEAAGWPVHGSFAGIMTCAGFRKPGFFRRQSFWSDKPMIHLHVRSESPAQGSFVGQAPDAYENGQPVIIECYSNLPEVALFLDKEEVGRWKGRNEDGIYLFSMTYRSGRLTAVGYDAAGSEAATQSWVPAQEAERLSVNCWQEADAITGAEWLQASHEIGYIYQIEVRVNGSCEEAAVRDDHNIEVHVWGDGELLGLENGNLADHTPYLSQSRSTWHGRLVAYIRRSGEGKIRVRIETDLPNRPGYQEMEL